MSEYSDENTITVNRNDKGDNEKRPDFRAKINVDGVVYWGSLWQRDGANGPFLSGPVEKADDKYQPSGGGSEAKADDKPAGDQQYF